MKLSALLLALLFQGMVAYSYALSLDDALGSAPSRPAVVSAAQAVAAARGDLARISADPYALKLEKAQARQRLALSRAQFRQAYFNAVSDIGNAYAAALLADHEERLAVANEALNRLYTEVARTRQQQGEATPLEVREAEATSGVATANRRSAAETASLRQATLRGLLPAGTAAERLEPIPTALVERRLPVVQALIGGADATVTLFAARQAVDLAQLTFDLLDPRYSAARNLKAAETQLAAAKATLAETTRSLHTQLRSLYTQTEAAQRLYKAQRTTAAAARSRLLAQRNRFSRGLASDLELWQAEYAVTAAQLELRRAKHHVFTSLLALQVAAATPVLEPGAGSSAEVRPR